MTDYDDEHEYWKDAGYGNLYDYPQNHGLELVGDIADPNLSWEFSIIALWREPATGALYFASDQGCSCPSPFEDCRSLADLTPLTTETWADFEATVIGQGNYGVYNDVTEEYDYTLGTSNYDVDKVNFLSVASMLLAALDDFNAAE